MESMKFNDQTRTFIGRLYSKLFLIVSILFVAGFAQNALAQGSKRVSGTIVSASDNLPIPGVNVVLKGTTTGTITDMDGKYTLTVSDNDVLVYSFIGYEAQEIIYAGQSSIDVSLVDESSDLDEVVVVGYGVQKKKLNTGATVQVKGDDIAKLNTTNPLQAM